MKPVASDPLGAEILTQLQSLDPHEQYFAVISICDLERRELLPAVLPLLQSRITDLRYLAVQTIGDMGQQDSAFFGPFLTPLLESDDPEMRQYAAEALGELDYQEAIPAIERMVRKETDDESLHFTMRALRMLRREALEEEEEGEDSEPIVRMMTVDLGASEPELRIPPVVH